MIRLFRSHDKELRRVDEHQRNDDIAFLEAIRGARTMQEIALIRQNCTQPIMNSSDWRYVAMMRAVMRIRFPR